MFISIIFSILFVYLGRVVVEAVVPPRSGIPGDVGQMNWCCWKMRYMRVEVVVVAVLDC